MRLFPLGDGLGEIPASGFGMSSSQISKMAGERIIMPDDNVTSSPDEAVFAYRVATPRTHGWQLFRTNLGFEWGSASAGAGAGLSYTNGDSGHIGTTSIETGTTTTGRFAVANAGGLSTYILSATSGLRVFDTKFRVPTLSNGTDTVTVRLGFGDSTTGDHVDGVYLELESNANANLQFKTASNSTRTTSDSGIAIVANTWYRSRIEIVNNTAANLYIAQEGTDLPSTPTVTITTNIPSGTSRAFLAILSAIKSAGTTNRRVDLEYALYGSDRYAA